MASNYKRGLYNQLNNQLNNQLIEVMACLDAMEKDLHEENMERKEDAFQPV